MSNSDSHEFIRLVCTHCGHTIDVPVYCGNRFCNVCGFRRRSRVRHRLDWCVSHTPHITGYSFKHLTLTLVSESDIRSMIKKLVSAFRRLRQRAFWKSKVSGGSYVIEITGRPGAWHAHLHVIIYSSFLPYHKLLQLWITCSGSRGVYIQRVPPAQVVSYLTKYLTKPDIPDVVVREIADSLSGYRLFHPFGSWYKISSSCPKAKSDCPICHHSCWLPLDLVYGTHISFSSRDPTHTPAYGVA